ncbi:protein TIFY 9 [Syzygium oleosum]|uniref:protein TIFY 9 n=1 Tax=Syzygium oleosum TaxID=219896 RepID=UPI0024B8EEAB|nr:protein TIFY 9 [Syzygium oleosum]
MPRAAMVELDFFALEKQTMASGPPEHRWTSSPGIVAGARSGYVHDRIRSGIRSAANPTIPSVENGVQFAPCDPFFVSPPASSFKRDRPNGFPAPTPAHSPLLRPTSDKNGRIAPMTIFYNGKMTVVDVPRIMAENILKLAMEECSKNPESEKPETAMPAPSHQHQWFESLNKYLPLARRKSLQRFLEKRKERLTSASPYHDPAHLPPRVSGFKN